MPLTYLDSLADPQFLAMSTCYGTPTSPGDSICALIVLILGSVREEFLRRSG
ncbi:MAG: hypothetical protein O2931_06655 [Planctomycetota bacterium]|nr:hypothetical protein [Planctomycetota bacterium]